MLEAYVFMERFYFSFWLMPSDKYIVFIKKYENKNCHINVLLPNYKMVD